MGKIYAVRMREYNKASGFLRRSWTAGKWNLQFTAGDATPRRPFKPSPVVEVSKEQYDYIMGRNADGVPNVGQPLQPHIPVFEGWICSSRKELADMVQKEADRRAAGGKTSARAILQLRGPIESEAVKQQQLDLGEKANKIVEVVPETKPAAPEPPPPSKIEPIDVEEELGKDTDEETEDAEEITEDGKEEAEETDEEVEEADEETEDSESEVEGSDSPPKNKSKKKAPAKKPTSNKRGRGKKTSNK